MMFWYFSSELAVDQSSILCHTQQATRDLLIWIINYDSLDNYVCCFKILEQVRDTCTTAFFTFEFYNHGSGLNVDWWSTQYWLITLCFVEL